MAKNRRLTDGTHLALPVTSPASPHPLSGEPFRLGALTGIALTDLNAGGNPTGVVSGDLSMAVYLLTCHAVNDGGNSAINAGDPLFYVDADTPPLSKKTAAGYFFGFAVPNNVGTGTFGDPLLAGGATGDICVLHIPSPGAGFLGAGTIGSGALASGAVLASKLTTTLATGYIPLPLSSAQLISAADYPGLAADGGRLASDTDPTLKRVNLGTDPNPRIAWAATSVIPIQWAFDYPPDLDDTANVVVHLQAGMGGAMDTPVLGVAYWERGGANVGGNTGALAPTVADATRTILAASVSPGPMSATVIVTPPAHANDAIYLYSAHIEYTRK